MAPFVKWAGGKTQLLGALRRRMPECRGRYYEPFIGGGALLLDVRPERAVISDANAQLVNVYRQLRADAEAVIAEVRTLDAPPCDRERYLALRRRYNAKIEARGLDAECAALFIWLNKHCFNGLYRVNAAGLFNVPYNNKTGGASINADNLRAVGRYLAGGGVEIRQGDFAAACADVRAGDFVYFDPPYVPASATARFAEYASGGFPLAEHRRLAAEFRRLDALGAKLLLSNHDVSLVRELYSGFTIETLAVRRAINCDASGREGREVIIANY